MDVNLESLLDTSAVEYQLISKSEKFQLLARWQECFPDLANTKLEWSDRNCEKGDQAWKSFSGLGVIQFFLLPQNMYPSFQCTSEHPPDLRILTDDDYSGCNEVIVVSCDFGWSLALINHTTEVGCYFFRRKD